MKMSYRHAWDLVDSMNRQSTSPVVTMVTGGAGGGGARLTPAGTRAVEAFWSAHRDFGSFLETRTRTLDL